MLTGLPLLFVFFCSIIVLLIIVIKIKLNPFLALLIISYLTGFTVKMPFDAINKNVAIGFGNTLQGIGIIIGLGIVLGIVLSKSGAMEKIARSILKLTGNKYAPLAICITGLIVSIPVFMDAAFVILFPLALSISRITKIPVITLTTALAIGLITSHSMIIPTPGPVEVVNNLQPDIGSFVGLAMLISIPVALIGGWLYGVFIGKRERGDTAQILAKEAVNNAAGLPGSLLSFCCLLMPIVLILFGSTIHFLFPNGNLILKAIAFVGDKNAALLVSVIFSIAVLKKYLRSSLNEMISEAGESAGMIMLITGAGGAYGYIVNQSGIGAFLVESMIRMDFSFIVTGFMLSALLRASLGSATVSLIATSAIIGPSMADAGASGVLVTIAICLGGIGFSLPNDSGFWVVSRFAKLSIRQTLASWSAGGTIAALSGFMILYILDIFL